MQYNTMQKGWTVAEALSWACRHLAFYNVPSPMIEAEYLLAYVLKCERRDLVIYPDRVLLLDEMEFLRDVVARRVKREPSQYIMGEEEFRGLSFKVNSDILIPRPETELLVEEALIEVRSKKLEVRSQIIDLCTGSGCIAICMAVELPNSKIYATDISEKAVEVAKENAKRHGVNDRISFFVGDLCVPIKGLGLEGEMDLILSNPPYISKKMMDDLQPEIKLYEPLQALYGGEDGLDFYRRIIHEAPIYLKSSGVLIIEIGYGQLDGVISLIEKEKVYSSVEVKKDFSGVARVVKAHIKVDSGAVEKVPYCHCESARGGRSNLTGDGLVKSLESGFPSFPCKRESSF